MTEQISDFVAREMHRVSAGTADCPNLIHRVAAGVVRRRHRRRTLAGALAATAALAVATPTLHLLPSAFSVPTNSQTADASQPNTGCSGLDAAACNAASVRAEHALSRANGSDVVSLWPDTERPHCLPRQSCRGPL